MPEIKGPEFINTRPDSFVNFYSNNVRVEVSPWDIKFIFGEVEKAEVSADGRSISKLYVEDRARISMSPEHAKAFLNVLQKNIEQFEKQVGPIPTLPEDKTIAAT